MNFKGKTALVTGAAQGIGRGTAVTFAQNGAKVVIVDVNEEKLMELKAELEKNGTEVLAYVCDISDEKKVNEVAADALEKFGRIDVLVNNAAVFRDFSDFVDSSTELWRKYIDINIMGTMFFTRALLPKMIENSYGKIVNVASVAGVYGNPKMVHYSATKGAVIAMTKALAKEVIDKGINVNCVSPGSVSEGDIDDVSYQGFASQATYIGRSGSHRENANLICFLASDEASYISGQNIQIDGCRKKL
ncbi:MAG: SDR family oxidoreductase [Clostridia bacterium]|nr:SDR family oxidoreductase [Clostridia bacterium]